MTDELRNRIDAVWSAETDNFVELCKIAQLNPASSFRSKNLSYVDFSGCDLEAFNFSGAILTGADFTNAKILNAIFDNQQMHMDELRTAVDYQEFSKTNGVSIGDDFPVPYRTFVSLIGSHITDGISLQTLIVHAINKVRALLGLTLHELFLEIEKYTEQHLHAMTLRRFIKEHDKRSFKKRTYLAILYWAYLRQSDFRHGYIFTDFVREIHDHLCQNSNKANLGELSALLLKHYSNAAHSFTPVAELLFLPQALSPREYNLWQNIPDILTTPFFGRDAELGLLAEFIDAKSDFLFCVMNGLLGSGKTRIAYEFMAQRVNGNEWDIGFLKDLQIYSWERVTFKRNTLIVIDEAEERLADVRAIVTYFCRASVSSASSPNIKVRVLLLSREMTFKSTFIDYTDDVSTSSVSQNSYFRSNSRFWFEKSPLHLGARESENNEILQKIIAHTSGRHTQSNSSVLAALQILLSMGQEAKQPLFATMLGAQLKSAPHLEENNSESLLILIARFGTDDLLQSIVKQYASNPKFIKHSDSLLILCSEKGFTESIIQVISAGTDVNFSNSNGDTALMRASTVGQNKAIRVLLREGANTEITNNQGFTALSLACLNGNTEETITLLNSGAAVNVFNDDGLTPLMLASANNYKGIVQALLKESANPNLVSKDSLSALDYANRHNNSEIAGILREYGSVAYE